MKVIKPGSKVHVKSDVDAMVLSVRVGESAVEYQVCWWDGLTRTTAWLAASEITRTRETKTTVIGFDS